MPNRKIIRANNRISLINAQQQPLVIYDAAGNITQDSYFTGAAYEYDANQRAKTVTTGGAPVRATYDALGQRVQTEYTAYGQTFTTRYVYDLAGQIVAEYEQGQLKRERVHRSGGLLATVEQATGGEQVSYVMQDHQGSTRVVTNQQGNVTSRHDYTPFGNEIGATVGTRDATQGYSQPSNVKQGFALTENDTNDLKHT